MPAAIEDVEERRPASVAVWVEVGDDVVANTTPIAVARGRQWREIPRLPVSMEVLAAFVVPKKCS